MTSIAEQFKAELLGRVQLEPLTDYGENPPQAERIRRSHLTHVPREEAPAVYVRFGDMQCRKNKSCNWDWVLKWTVSLYLRSDSDSDADPLVIAALKRIDPALPYANDVVVEIERIDGNPEIADKDSVRVDIAGTAAFSTPAWNLEARV